MTEQAGGKRVHEKWATFRFSVIGLLLAAPPPRGELDGAIAALAERTWHHPISGKPVRFGFSTDGNQNGRCVVQKTQRCNLLTQ